MIIKKKNYPNFSQSLTDIKCIPEMIKNYKLENNITSKDKIYVTLAVDALYFKPDVHINSKGIVTGFLDNNQIKKKEFDTFSKDINSFIEFIKNNWNNIIKAGFVFQINPLKVSLKPIVLNITPSSNGKANSSIIDMLFEIKSILHNYRVEVISFSFDGDNCYHNLNQVFFHSYINKMIKSNSLPQIKTLTLRITPDFYHIIKRLRYRFLSHLIHMHFNIISPMLNKEQIQSVLNHLPPVVFLDIPLTKMNDQLPLQLFSLENLLILFKHKLYNEAAFWFPISLAITAYSHHNIGYQNRKFLLECSLWFLAFYKKCYDEYIATLPKDAPRLKERNYQGISDVLPYTNDLLMEFCNNLFSNITIVDKFDNVDVDRNSTSPLEHTFGRGRVKSKNVHTITKFIMSINDMNFESLKKTYSEIEQIRGRSLNFGVVMEDKKDSELLFASTPQQIASEMLSLIDINVIEDEPITNYDNLFTFMLYLHDFVEERHNKSMTINKITLGTQQTKTINQRISFTISKDSFQIVEFFKNIDPNQKIKKDFLLAFYKNLKANVPLFPSIQNKNPTKKILIDHLQSNFYPYKDKYLFIMSILKSTD